MVAPCAAPASTATRQVAKQRVFIGNLILAWFVRAGRSGVLTRTTWRARAEIDAFSWERMTRGLGQSGRGRTIPRTLNVFPVGSESSGENRRPWARQRVGHTTCVRRGGLAHRLLRRKG